MASPTSTFATACGSAVWDDMIQRPPPTSPVQALGLPAQLQRRVRGDRALGGVQAQWDCQNMAPEYHAGPTIISTLAAYVLLPEGAGEDVDRRERAVFSSGSSKCAHPGAMRVGRVVEQRVRVDLVVDRALGRLEVDGVVKGVADACR